MLAVIIPIAVLHIGAAAFVGIFYIVCYLVYRNTYLNNTYSFEWGNSQSSSVFPLPGDPNFNMCKAQIQGTYEANVTGNAFVTKNHTHNF